MDQAEKLKRKKEKSAATYMKYAGLAFQFLVTFGVVLYIGKRLDAYCENERMYITVVLIVITFLGIMYSIMKDLKT